MKKRIALRITAIILVTLNCAAVFFFSSRNADQSNSESQLFSDSLATKILMSFDLTEEQIEKINSFCVLVVRKTAHFAEFASLGFLLSLTCFSFGKSNKFSFIVSQSAATLYGISDELHQLFVPGRSCQAKDVLVDSLGALSGILLALLIRFLAEKIRKKRQTKKV